MSVPLRVLIVERDSDAAGRAVKQLIAEGIEVESLLVGTGWEIAEALAQSKWDLVLSDHDLEGLGASIVMELTDGLHERPPVIVVAGDIGEAATAEVIRAGAADFVSKHELEQLPHIVRRTLRRAEAERARHTASTALRDGEERLRSILDSTAEGHALITAIRDPLGTVVDFRCEYVNAALCAMSGLAREGLIGERLMERFPAQRDVGLFDAYCNVVETGTPLHREEVLYRETLGERTIDMAIDVRAAKIGDGCVITVQSVTERKHREAEQQELYEHRLRLHSFLIAALERTVRGRDPDEIFTGVCETAVQEGGFSLAWVGIADQEGQIDVRVSAGKTTFLEHEVYGDVVGEASIDSPAAMAQVEVRPVFCDISLDPMAAAWRDQALAHGFGSCAALPLLDEQAADDVAGILVLYAQEAGFFTDEYRSRLEGLAGVMSLAFRATEEQRETSQESGFHSNLADSMVEGLCALDDQGRVTYVNRAAQRLLGWGERELMGRPLHDAVHRHDVRDPLDAIVECPLLRAIAHGTEIVVEEDAFIGKSGQPLSVSYSVAPLHDRPGVDGDRLERRSGRKERVGTVVVFSDVTARRLAQRERRAEVEELSWASRIRDTPTERRLVLFAQPIVELASRAVVGHELLVRVVGSDGTIASPDQFMPAAERFGVLGELDAWVGARAVDLAAAGHRVSFNLSARSLCRGDAVAAIERWLSETHVERGYLTCEITEAALASEPAAEAAVHRLADAGCTITLDDFGAGYGGFTYLTRVPVTRLKIDADFIRDLHDSVRNQHIVKSLVTLADGLGMETSAEGIEDKPTLEQLGRFGVGYVQGYLLGPPRPLEEALISATGE